MIKVALKGLAARRLRTALTALAIVLGVAMVSGAFTITDTMRGAADSLGKAAYDGTDAVVVADSAFQVDAGDWSAKRPTVDAGLVDAGPRRARRRGRRRRHHGRGQDHQARRQAGRRRPVLRRRLRRRRSRAPSASRRSASTPGRWADRRRRGRDRRRHRRGPGLRRRLDGADHGPRPRARLHASSASRRFGSVKSLGIATAAVFDLETAQGAVRARRPGRRDPRRRHAPRATRSPARACPRPRSRPPRRRTASRSTGWSSSSRSSGSRCSSSAASRSWSARSPSSTRSRSPSPSARVSWGCCGWSAASAARCSAPCWSRRWSSASARRVVGLFAGLGLAKALDALFDAMKLVAARGGHGVRRAARSSCRCCSARW